MMKPQTVKKLLGASALAVCVGAYADMWQDSYRMEAAGKYGEAARVLGPKVANSEYAQLRTAYLAYMEGRFADSVAGYQRAMAANPHSIDAMLGLTLPLLAQRRCGDVVAVAKRVIQKSAWQYTAHLRLMQCDEMAFKWSSLTDTARQLTDVYPSDATAWVYFARGQIGLKNGAGARLAYERVLEIVPGHKEAMGYLGQ